MSATKQKDSFDPPSLGRSQSSLALELAAMRKPVWSDSRFQEVSDLPEKTKVGFFDSFISCFVETNNYYVKMIMCETREDHCTTPLNMGPNSDDRDACESDFRITPELGGVKRFNTGHQKTPRALTFRVVIMDSVVGTEDKLIGHGQCNLDKLIIPKHSRAKKKRRKNKSKSTQKGKKKPKWRPMNHQPRQMYVKIPTEKNGADTGTVYLHLDYRPDSNCIIIECLGATDVYKKFDWKDEEEENRAIGMKEIFIYIFLVMYIMSAAYLMNHIEGANPAEGCEDFAQIRSCLWFVLVTFASVGYGDMYPCTDLGQIVNGTLIIINQLTLAWFFSLAAQLFLLQSEAFRSSLARVYTCLGITDAENASFNVGDEVYTRDESFDLRTAVITDIIKEYDEMEKMWKVQYEMNWLMDRTKASFMRVEEECKKIKPLTLEKLFWRLFNTLAKTGSLVLFMAFLGTLMFHYLEHDQYKDDYDAELTYANTFHFSLVTMATVGYGDWAPSTMWGQAFGSLFILAGVTLLANFAGIVVNYFIQRQELLDSQEFLNNSLVTPEQILDFDMDGDGEVTKFEYLVKALQACKFVNPDKIDLIMAKFYDIDTDKSGQISLADFQDYADMQNAASDEELEGVEGRTNTLQDLDLIGERIQE